jgi:tRNA 2-thiouridine synthesizing protein A
MPPPRTPSPPPGAAAGAPPPAVRLDVTGKLCPLPVLLARRAIARLAPGERLAIVGDDPLMAVDIPVWAEKEGHRLLDLVAEPSGRVTCIVERGEDASAV